MDLLGVGNDPGTFGFRAGPAIRYRSWPSAVSSSDCSISTPSQRRVSVPCTMLRNQKPSSGLEENVTERRREEGDLVFEAGPLR